MHAAEPINRGPRYMALYSVSHHAWSLVARSRYIVACRTVAPQSLHDIIKQRIPASKSGEGLRLRSACVAAFAFERQHVLAEVIG
jgi:hypothetical protein